MISRQSSARVRCMSTVLSDPELTAANFDPLRKLSFKIFVTCTVKTVDEPNTIWKILRQIYFSPLTMK